MVTISEQNELYSVLGKAEINTEICITMIVGGTMGIAINKTVKSQSLHGVVSKNVKSYGEHPYFVKKAEQAKKTLDKVGLPQSKKK